MRLDLSELRETGWRCVMCQEHELDRPLKPLPPAVAGPFYCRACAVLMTTCEVCRKVGVQTTVQVLRRVCKKCVTPSVGSLKKTPMDSKCKKSTSGYTAGHSWYNTATQVRACRRCGRAKDFEDNELFIGGDGQLRHYKS